METIENFENGDPREKAYRESSLLSVVDGRERERERVVRGSMMSTQIDAGLKWKKDKPRTRRVYKRREREREREKWKKKWKVEERIRQKFEREWR